VDTPAFLPHLEGLRLDEYTATAGRIALRVATTTATAPCPACQHPSRRIHSRSVRTVADVAWGGVPVTLRVHVRRFFCGNTACLRRIFAERLPRLVDRYARQTGIRRTALQRIGVASDLGRRTRLKADADSPKQVLGIVRRWPARSAPPPSAPGTGGVARPARLAHPASCATGNTDVAPRSGCVRIQFRRR